ncbi:ABC transporter substrate-binding protein [Lapillicoccus jejuensis]|uniref:Iron complex transport system substrate-binding protein n=1 Tax=Lapillicoccus jejuensis TaxID=402171 RepID=A0A542E1N5_9MICO|nr:ABC transporter substrate-binding protein [Lapillicoccus jejuensis]TQJ09252.1 iron complex transport system substrate-binding protein [Lapillicoccus jejuensis]
MRIVSLLPSATEMLFGLGAGDDVVGVTFECDTPAEARTRRVVSTSSLPEGLSPAEIDAVVSARVRAGEDLYHLDEGALAGLDADLVVTQDLCAVCAVDVDDVQAALGHLGCRADVLTLDPHTLDEVLGTLVTLGDAVGRGDEARAQIEDLRDRLDAVRLAVEGLPRPKVLLLEWADPPYAPGHWVPEMILAAGGEPTIGEVGGKSTRVTWEQALATPPDVVVVAPCGYDLAASAEQARELLAAGVLPDGVLVRAMDSNGCVARPGPRLVDGVEDLAKLLHPGELGGLSSAEVRRHH